LWVAVAVVDQGVKEPLELLDAVVVAVLLADWLSFGLSQLN
jgi:hypothetical protein